jgi:phosphate transport system permease protein
METGGWTLVKLRDFPSHPAPVVALAASPRDKGFLSGDERGEVRLQYSTSERTLATLAYDGTPGSLLLAPRADGALVLGESGGIALWDVHNPHPEVSWRTLFGKVWYEGLEEPAYVWQSTGMSDDFESKMSLIPLLFGTIKGALYAMLFSVPIAVLGAIYTTLFAHPRVKSAVKPFVEILAAVPSVIIGFLAGLWLAPLLAEIFPHVLLILLFIPLLVLAGSLGWEALPGRIRGRFPLGTELYLIMGVAFLGGALGFLLGPTLEQLAFGGDFPQWVVETLGLRFDPRNSVVVGFALGFAVIPIIFTIAEDAMSTVPRHLVTASLALGASRWATAWRVVVPTASAGIFSAIMLGFGRAVGETMIVLMATGNTPILDWSPFVGMRTLSANIAVEIPEAPHGGTLYRVLFLSGALLFILTFFTNTLAEVVSHRLRQKYKRL